MSLAGASQVVILTAATLTGLGVIARVRPVRWVWRKTVAEPVMTAFRREVAEVVDERLDARPLTNGWGARAMQSIAEQVGAAVESPPPLLAPEEDSP